MALLIMAPGEDATPWVKRFLELAPDLDVRVWPWAGDPDEVEMALVWHHPHGELARFEKLRCIASMGAGVDAILADPDLPRDVPVTRVVDPSLAAGMTEYVVWAVLHHCRDMEKYRADQSAMAWLPVFPRPRGETSVGIMGLGQLGSHAAATLRDLGFPVLGWSRTPKGIAGVATHWGKEGLGGFLTRTWILVCLLPLTPETRGILNRRTFAALPRGAYLINVARGAHLAKEDLLEALGSGQLSGACLDVFETEPLPAGHPFWSHPRIMVTPHVSSLTDPQAVAVQILENYCRLRRGEPLVHVVDRQRGY